MSIPDDQPGYQNWSRILDRNLNHGRRRSSNSCRQMNNDAKRAMFYIGSNGMYVCYLNKRQKRQQGETQNCSSAKRARPWAAESSAICSRNSQRTNSSQIHTKNNVNLA